MPTILIHKDAATVIPREVADLTDARAFEEQGFRVELLAEDGTAQPLPPAEPELMNRLMTDEERAALAAEIEARQDQDEQTKAPAPKKAAKKKAA